MSRKETVPDRSLSIHIRLSSDSQMRLKTLAAVTGSTIQEVVTSLIDEHLDEK